jgi:hypothetical protein
MRPFPIGGNMSRTKHYSILYLVGLLGLTTACQDSEPDPFSPPAASVNEAGSAPSPLIPVSFAGWQTELWPFTGNATTGAISDPINVLFPNRDAREIRASLMFLDGNRTAFGLPNAAPFNCTWKDAVGDPQNGYTTEAGWTASVIQLECGDYAPMRFHLRLFPSAGSTIANGHFEVVVPGTNQHEVLSWELAETLVKIDFLRSGLLDPAAPIGVTPVITPTPTFGTVNPLIYNGLPVPLRAVIGGPLGNVAAPWPMPNDGRATILNLANAHEAERAVIHRELAINFNQTIPKPFCSTGPFDYVRVTGVINIDQTIMTKPGGDFTSRFHAHGSLDVTPVNPLTGAVLGDTYKAVINEQQRNVLTDERTLVTMLRMQKLITGDGPIQGMLNIRVELGSGTPEADVQVTCNP